MKKIIKATESLKTRKATIAFAAASLIGGLFFLNYTNITGSVVSEGIGFSNLFSIIGALLLACSAILIAYTIRNK